MVAIETLDPTVRALIAENLEAIGDGEWHVLTRDMRDVFTGRNDARSCVVLEQFADVAHGVERVWLVKLNAAGRNVLVALRHWYAADRAAQEAAEREWEEAENAALQIALRKAAAAEAEARQR